MLDRTKLQPSIRPALLFAGLLAAAAAAIAPGASAHARHAQCIACTPEQRDAFRTTEELVRRLWLQSRRAHLSVRKEGATDERVEGQLEALRASFSEAWRAHETFLASLDTEQREVLSVRTGRIEDIRRRALDAFDDLERVLAEPPPNQARASRGFGQLSRGMRHWRRQLERVEWHAKM